jgi:hypothetical protein
MGTVCAVGGAAVRRQADRKTAERSKQLAGCPVIAGGGSRRLCGSLAAFFVSSWITSLSEVLSDSSAAFCVLQVLSSIFDTRLAGLIIFCATCCQSVRGVAVVLSPAHPHSHILFTCRVAQSV